MKYPIDELLDRKSIMMLKLEHCEDRLEKEMLKDYINMIINAIENYIADNVCDLNQVQKWTDELYSINKTIWKLEADIRNGKLSSDLTEVGRRAIEIRNNNGLRVSVKNKIVEHVQTGFKDIKINHVSQEYIE
ncbi:MAG: hypothetical protein AB2806_21470 [Candidatus Thiodiazotropha sp.]